MICHCLAATLAAAARGRQPHLPALLPFCHPQLDPNDSVDTLRAVLEAETGLPAEQQRLLLNGRDIAAGCVQGKRKGAGAVGESLPGRRHGWGLLRLLGRL